MVRVTFFGFDLYLFLSGKCIRNLLSYPMSLVGIKDIYRAKQQLIRSCLNLVPADTFETAPV